MLLLVLYVEMQCSCELATMSAASWPKLITGKPNASSDWFMTDQDTPQIANLGSASKDEMQTRCV